MPKPVWRILIILFISTSFHTYADDSPSKLSDVEYLTRDRQKGEKYSNLLKTAWQQLFMADYRAASKSFKIILDAPDSIPSEKVQSLFALAMLHQTHISKPNLTKAAEYYNQILQQYPDNPAAPWALIQLGKMQGFKTRPEHEAAVPFYTRAVKEYPDSAALHEATLLLASSSMIFQSREIARTGKQLLENHLIEYPDNPLAVIMHDGLTRWYETADRDYKKGQYHALIVGRLRMCDPFRWGQQYWNIAQTYLLRLNNPREARKWFQKILDECPRAWHRYMAKIKINEIDAILKNTTSAQEPSS